MTSTLLPKMCNAWIYLNEDEPKNTAGVPVIYDDPTSSFQRLITENIYQHVDILFICFAETVPTSSNTIPPGDGSSYTIQMGQGDHPTPPPPCQVPPPPPPIPIRYTNQNYLDFVVRDARRSNPKIKILMTLVWGRGIDLVDIFLPNGKTDTQNAQSFAENLLSFLQAHDLDGFDIDWEFPISDRTSKSQMTTLMVAIGSIFAQQTKKYWFTLSPVTTSNLDGPTVNTNIDFLNLQIYGGTSPFDYTSIGIESAKLAYGAKFESKFESANTAYDAYQKGGYQIATTWRLNSGNYVYEQDNQKAFYNLIHGS